jgi:D-arabinose 1-dehydrogenase-like Zn-dependent alcohol dehydrogenase
MCFIAASAIPTSIRCVTNGRRHFQPRIARNIKADIELIRADQINHAIDRVKKKDVRYRFVIDMASLKT